MSELIDEIRSRIAKRNRRVGSGYEVEVAKKISTYFGYANWDEAFTRTRPSSSKNILDDDGKKIRIAGAQKSGDLVPVGEMARHWYGHGLLGPIEAKHVESWSLAQLFKNPERSVLYKFWVESNTNTNSSRSVLFFSKMRSLDFVLHLTTLSIKMPCLMFKANDDFLAIRTLDSFLHEVFPTPNSSN